MLRKLLAISLLSVLSFCVHAQSSAASREFWVSCFGDNSDLSLSLDSTLQEFFILISSPSNSSGTIKNVNTGYEKSFTLIADSIQKIYIPYDQIYNNSDKDSLFVTNRSIVINTTDSATVYMGNYQRSTYDATAVFPLKSLGYSYQAIMSNHPINYNKYYNQYYYNTAAINIIATEENTLLKFNLANTVTFGTTTYLANTDYYITLNKGETFNVVGLSLLGSTFESLNCKKIAVFSGNYCAQMPYECLACDLIVEQMPPTNTYGKEFLIMSTLDRPYDSKVYIAAIENNSLVEIIKNNTNYNVTLNKGQYIDLWGEQTGIYIKARKPIAVTQFAVGTQYSHRGDPMMMWINSNEQMVKKAVFSAPITTFVTNHYLLVFTKTADVNKSYLDGVNIASEFTVFTQNTDYSYARIEVSPLTHYLENQGGFLAYVYGYDSGGNYTQESYGYSINDVFHNTEDYYDLGKVGDTKIFFSYETSELNNTYDVNDSIQINRTILSKFDSVSWLLNNIDYKIIPTDTASINFSFRIPASDLQDGENSIAMLIYRSCRIDTIDSPVWLRKSSITASIDSIELCPSDSVSIKASTSVSNANYIWIVGTDTINIQSDSIRIQGDSTVYITVSSTLGNYVSEKDSILLIVHPIVETHLYDSICPSEIYDFNGQSLSLAGIYTDTLKSSFSCDSIVYMHLKMRTTIKEVFEKEICDGDSILFDGAYYDTQGVYKNSYISSKGCDSTRTLILDILPTDSLELFKTIYENETYNFNGQILSSTGNYIARLSNQYGCDSIILLILKIDSLLEISIPEGFSPNGDGINDLFEIKNIELYENNQIWIFNRWGNKLFEAKPYMNDWDGSSKYGIRNGDAPPTGTYFYILDLGNGSPVRKGYVWLQRE